MIIVVTQTLLLCLIYIHSHLAVLRQHLYISSKELLSMLKALVHELLLQVLYKKSKNFPKNHIKKETVN